MRSVCHLMHAAALCATALGLVANAADAATVGAARPALSNTSPRPAAATGTLTVLHQFSGNDGSAPEGSLDLAVGISGRTLTRTLYGETEGGGATGSGTLFAYTIGTNAVQSLYSFTGGNDGAIPVAGLANNATDYIVAGSPQLGVAIAGGAAGNGTVFAVGANGVLRVVHAFTGGADGSAPSGRLTRFIDGNYYGTTSSGALGFGTIFRITRWGQFSTIYTFTGNADGGAPSSGLALRVDLGRVATPNAPIDATIEHVAATSPQAVAPYLYGTTSTGGSAGAGTLFRVTPAGRLQILHAFTGAADGAAPEAPLTSDLCGNLYGTTSGGGSQGNGVIFKIARGSTAPVTLYDFGNGATGAVPVAPLALAFNGKLYGVASQGGASGQFGSVFAITPSGAFSDIHDFSGTDGQDPETGLVDGGDGNLYGATIGGGLNADGVLFSVAE